MRNLLEMPYFKKLLKVCNKFGYRFMKPYAIDSLLWRSRYDELLETEIWKIAKHILLKVKEFEPDGFNCYFCDELVNPQKALMHYRRYEIKEIFHPKHIRFAHYQCHKEHHRQKRSF